MYSRRLPIRYLEDLTLFLRAGPGSRSEIFGLWVLFRRSVTVALWGWRVEDLIIPGAPIVDRLFSKGEAHLNFGCQRSLGISFFFTVVSGHPRESE